MLVYFIVAIFTVQSRVSFVTLGRRGDTIYFDLYSKVGGVPGSFTGMFEAL